MNSLFKLLKVNFINGTGLNVFSKNQSSSKTKNKLYKSSTLIILGAIGIVFLAYLYAVMLAEGLKTINALSVLPILAGIVVSIATFFTSVYKAPGTLFSSKDYDMLMSFPIDSKVILASKMLNLLSLNLGISAAVLLPTTIVYYQMADASIICFLYALIGIVLLPLIPMILASLLAFALNYASSKSKFTNIVSLTGMFIIMLGIFLASTKMQDILAYFSERASKLEDIFGKVYPPAGWYGELIGNSDIMSLFKLLVVSILPFIVFLLIFGRSFKKINARLGESYKRANYKLTSLRSESPIKALIRKEIKRYISCNIYVFNTAFGALFMLIGAIATIFMKEEAIVALIGAGDLGEMLPLMLIIGYSFLVVTACTTASSISLEGKNLWILKSLPVNVTEVFIGKMAVTLLISIPPVIISSVIMKFSLNLSLSNLVWIILIPSVFSVLISILGLYINLCYPKLDWTQEIKVVKQSISVMITIFGGIGFIAVAVVIARAFNIMEPTNTNIVLGAIFLVIVIAVIGAWNLLKSDGVKRFNEL